MKGGCSSLTPSLHGKLNRGVRAGACVEDRLQVGVDLVKPFGRHLDVRVDL